MHVRRWFTIIHAWHGLHSKLSTDWTHASGHECHVSYCIIYCIIVFQASQSSQEKLFAQGRGKQHISFLRCWHIASADWSMLTEKSHCSPQALCQGAHYAADSSFFASSCIHYVDIFHILRYWFHICDFESSALTWIWGKPSTPWICFATCARNCADLARRSRISRRSSKSVVPFDDLTLVVPDDPGQKKASMDIYGIYGILSLWQRDVLQRALIFDLSSCFLWSIESGTESNINNKMPLG